MLSAQNTTLLLQPVSAGCVLVASAGLLVRNHLAHARRLSLPTHDEHAETLQEKAAADVPYRFLVNGAPVDEERFWQHLFWHKLAILCFALAATICLSVSLMLPGPRLLTLSLGMQLTQLITSVYLCFIAVLYLRTHEMKANWAITQHAGYIDVLNLLLPFASACTAVIEPRTKLAFWYLEHTALRPWYISAAIIHLATLVWIGALPIAPSLTLDQKGLYTRRIDAAIDEARKETEDYATEVVGSASSSCISYLLFLFGAGSIHLFVTKTRVDLPDLPAPEAKSRSHMALSKGASYQQRVQTTSVLRRVFGPYLRPLIFGNILECIFLCLTYVPYLCLQKILHMMETGQRDVSIGLVYASVAVLAKAVPELGDIKLWDLHHTTVNDNAKMQVSLLVWFKALRRRTFTTVAGDAGAEKKAAQGLSNADVMNMVSSDADNVPKLSYTLRKIMTGPAEICVGGLFVWYVMGVSGLWGIASLVLTAPLTYILAKFNYGFERRRIHFQDINIARLQELVQAISHIKTTAQESYWRRIMTQTKRQETKMLLWSKLLGAVVTTIHTASPLLITVVAFAHFTLIRGERLTPSLAFTTIAAFNQLRRALIVLPQVLADSLRHAVSLRRVSIFMQTPDVDPTLTLGADMEVRSAVVSWASDADSAAFRLRGVSLNFPRGALSLITGKAGSGKSLLVHSLLGEVVLEAGSIIFPKSDPAGGDDCVAFVPQVAWLISDSIRSNILFGAPFDEERYLEVLTATCLIPDLLELEDGDRTEIGERGKILSGGQKARVSLARAVYSRASTLVMDDVLSAVDASTAARIISRCFQGPLCTGRSVIVVSHAVAAFAPLAAFACTLEDGVVVFSGTGPDLLARQSKEDMEETLPRNASSSSSLSSSFPTLVGETAQDTGRTENLKQLLLDRSAAPLVQDEARATGAAPWLLWRDFLAKNGSYTFWSLIIGIEAIVVAGPLLQRSNLRKWSEAEACSVRGDDCPAFSLASYLWTYAGLCFVAALAAGVLHVIEGLGVVRVTNTVFCSMLDHVLGAKSRFYVTNTVGAIVQRFSRDLQDVDQCQEFLLEGLEAFASLFVALAVLGWIGGLPILILLCIICGLLTRMYGPFRAASREIRRLMALTGGPVNALLGESVAGAAVIRVAGRELSVTKEFLGALNAMNTAHMVQGFTWRWMQARLALIRVIVFAFVLYAVVLDRKMSAATAGFYVAFSSTVLAQLADLMHYSRRLDTNSVCLERTKDYCELPQEISPDDRRLEPTSDWPACGTITVSQVSARYADNLPAVITDVSFAISGGQRVGVVGATGSGKSTLVRAFFSFVDITQGRIVIDGQDISQLNLQSVRERITMIGQDPTILSGSLRSNLDPDGTYSDAELYRTLQQVRLIPTESEHSIAETDGFVNVFNNLDTVVQAGGANFSVGQKQLLVIARALLRSHRILILDEATSSIDSETDEVITDVIRDNFADSTILVIAHRLKTIIQFDSIIVMDKGRVVQQGKPADIISVEGPFQTLCKASGEEEYAALCRLAQAQE